MSKKKSYMNQSNLITEGFFDKIKTFLQNRPKAKGKERVGLLNKIKLALKTAGVNKSIDQYEKLIKKRFGKDYPDLPRFKPEDFLR